MKLLARESGRTSTRNQLSNFHDTNKFSIFIHAVKIAQIESSPDCRQKNDIGIGTQANRLQDFNRLLPELKAFTLNQKKV